jgi:hypothetical protein
MAVRKEIPQVDIPQPKKRVKKDNVTPIRPDIVKNVVSTTSMDAGIGVLKHPGVGTEKRNKGKGKDKSGGNEGGMSKGKKVGFGLLAGGVAAAAGFVALEATDTIDVISGFPAEGKYEDTASGIKTSEDSVKDLENEGIVVEDGPVEVDIKPVENGPAIPVEDEEEMVSKEMQEKFAMAPEIDGLYKDIQEKDGIEKVVYLYDADNPYNGVEDEYAGEFKKEVMVENSETGEMEEVGGVVLKPEIVKQLIDEVKPDSRFTYDDGINTFAIPLDISGMEVEDIKISYMKNNKEVKFEFDGYLPIICIALGREDIDSNYVLRKHQGENSYLIEDLVRNEAINEEYHRILNPWNDSREKYSLDQDLVTRYIYFIGDFNINIKPTEVSEQINFGKFVYGEKICEVSSGLICTDWGLGIDYEEDCLKIDDKLVFLCGNN